METTQDTPSETEEAPQLIGWMIVELEDEDEPDIVEDIFATSGWREHVINEYKVRARHIPEMGCARQSRDGTLVIFPPHRIRQITVQPSEAPES